MLALKGKIQGPKCWYEDGYNVIREKMTNSTREVSLHQKILVLLGSDFRLCYCSTGLLLEACALVLNKHFNGKTTPLPEKEETNKSDLPPKPYFK